MKLGTTYSHRHSEFLHLDSNEAFEELLSFHFDLIRLCCYWDEIEPQQGVYDFSKIDHLLQRCQTSNQKVLLTVGMKAPRWPEFYIPSWVPNSNLEAELLFYVTKVVTVLGKYSCIIAWQIENEPLDPSGKLRATVPFDTLKREVECVRSLDTKRQIVITLWGNELTKRNHLSAIADIADTIGLDMYYKVPTRWGTYQGPHDSSEVTERAVKNQAKPIWITELQAEPWENNEIVPASGNPPSMNVSLFLQNYTKAKELHPEYILFWGYEYWYWKKRQGDTRLSVHPVLEPDCLLRGHQDSVVR